MRQLAPSMNQTMKRIMHAQMYAQTFANVRAVTRRVNDALFLPDMQFNIYLYTCLLRKETSERNDWLIAEAIMFRLTTNELISNS